MPGNVESCELGRDLLWAAAASQLLYLDATGLASTCHALGKGGRPGGMAEAAAGLGLVDGRMRAEVEGLVARKLDHHGGDVRAAFDATVDRTALGVLAGSGSDAIREWLDAGRSPEALTVAEVADPRGDDATEVDPGSAFDPDATVAETEPGGPAGTGTAPAPGWAGGGWPGPCGPGPRHHTLKQVLGKGGLGLVWVARDPVLKRVVALKELHDHHSENPELVRRFIMEAQITGQLEHPNIVPVYQLDRRPGDDRCYYTMRMVRGRTLGEAIAEFHRAGAGAGGPIDRLGLTRLLGHFAGICNAIAYAHSQGVVHRDLKPQNVVLGDFGEAILLDWGLAKLRGRSADAGAGRGPVAVSAPPGDAAETMAGSIMGTPAYMAPEQAEGRLDLVDEQSDIFGLGAILFEILTGRPPYQGASAREVCKLAEECRPPRAREVNRSVPPGLDAICAKALAKDRGRRYAAASALAEEVQRWLADEPIAALPDSPLRRAARWARRHRSWTASAAAALAITAVVSVAATVLVDGARRQEAGAKREAVRRFLQAHEAVDTLLIGVSDGLADVPGADRVRTRLLRKAADAYKEFARATGDGATFRAESARALLRLAEVDRILGDAPRAVEECRAAGDLFRALLAADPGATDLRMGLAESDILRGRVLNAGQRNDEALAAFGEAVGTLARLAAGRPDLAEPRVRLAFARLGMGITLKDLNRPEEARTALDQAIRTYTGLIAARPGHPEAAASRSGRARALISLANLEAALPGREDREEAALRGAIADLADLVRADREVREYRALLATSQMNLGVHLYGRATRDPAGAGPTADLRAAARDAFRAAIEGYQSLVADNTVPGYLAALIDARNDLAALLDGGGKPREAEKVYLAAINDAEALLRANPDDPAYLRSAGAAWHNYGLLLQNQCQYPEAAPGLDRAVEVRSKLERRGLAGDRRDLAVSLYWRSLNDLELGAAARAARDIARFAETFPESADDYAVYQFNAACCWSRLSRLASAPAPPDCARKAVAALQKAAARGFDRWEFLEQEKDLDPIRALPEFRAFLRAHPPRPDAAPKPVKDGPTRSG